MHAVQGESFDRENPFERVRRFASFRKNILDQVTTTHQENTGTRLVLQPDATLFPVPLFFFFFCCCSILHRSKICSSFFPESQGALFCSSASSLSTQISHTSDKCGVTSLTLVKNSAVSTGEQCRDNFPATTQCVNLLHAQLRPSWPDSKSLKTPHNRRTLQKVSYTCQKRYTTQWGWRQRHVSGLQTTLLFNWFKMRQVPRGARWRNETSHSLGNSHSSRTVYVFRVERGRGRGGYISWGTISWRRQQGPSPAPAY